MDESEQRHIARDSLFVFADLRLPGADTLHRIKVRNLSAGGMMGEGPVRVSRGSTVSVNIRNAGWVDGTVAWVQENRFGVAFNDEITIPLSRPASVSTDEPPEYIQQYQREVAMKAAKRGLRKV